jgi:hypothetical protein
MYIHHVNALPPLILQKLVLHLPNLVIDPLITRFDILQLVRCDSDIFRSNDASGTCRRFVGVVKYSTLASGDLGGCIKSCLDMLRRDEISAVRYLPKVRQT